MKNVVHIKNLEVVFDTDEGCIEAVRDITLSIREGETLGLVGESGCGKSVTSMSILRLIPCPPGRITGGEILFDGQDLLTLPIPQLRRIRGQAIGMIFQEPMTALSPLHRIGSQLVEAWQFHYPLKRREAWEQSLAWLEKVGIPDPAQQMYAYPYQLSGGMRQRVMIAAAMMMAPRLLIADEPTTALDVTIQAQILDLMRAMKKADTSVLLITHDMGVIWEMCERVAVMYAGEIVEVGDVEPLFNTPLHPYTEALLQSIPSLAEGRGRLPTIKGQVPSPLEYPAGCRFSSRCPHAFDRCLAEHPTLKKQGARQVRCFLHDEGEVAS
ncbi:MAG: ABC transporter ATP-binding protein [Spartobacteria bacterium]|nr:ABC transporter ATP-binding protein [Spartobacteria bacterium]